MISKRKHLTKIYLTIIVVYVIGEFVIWWLPIKPYRTEMEVLTDYQVARSETLAGGEIILLGDSSLGNAIDESRLSEIVGKPCRNLALVALFGPQADTIMLRKILSDGHKPEAIVLMHTPQDWNHEGGDAGISDLVDQAGPLSLDSIANSTFGRLPSVQRSRSYKSIFFSVRVGFQNNPFVYERALKRQDESKRLISSIGYIPQKSEIAIPDEPGVFGKPSLYPRAEEKLRELFSIAEEEGIPMLICYGPFWEGRVASDVAFIDWMDDWLDSVLADYQEVEFLYRGVPAAPGDLIGDTLEHLNDDGAEQFTEWFGPLLKRRLAGEGGIGDSATWNP